MIRLKLTDKKVIISALIVIVFIAVLFNIERITGSVIVIENSVISVSSDGENFIANPSGNEISISAGDLLYVQLTPAANNRRVFVYDPRYSSKADTFETKCFEKQGSKCISSLAVYKIPTDRWVNGAYTIKIAGVTGKAEFALTDSKKED